MYEMDCVAVIGMGKPWYGPFSILTNKIEISMGHSKFNIAISVVNVPFCVVCVDGPTLSQSLV